MGVSTLSLSLSLSLSQVYRIDVLTEHSHWYVCRRYSEFHDLHRTVGFSEYSPFLFIYYY